MLNTLHGLHPGQYYFNQSSKFCSTECTRIGFRFFTEHFAFEIFNQSWRLTEWTWGRAGGGWGKMEEGGGQLRSMSRSNDCMCPNCSAFPKIYVSIVPSSMTACSSCETVYTHAHTPTPPALTRTHARTHVRMHARTHARTHTSPGGFLIF